MSVRDPIYADGGYDPTLPYDNREMWWDDDARLVWTVDSSTSTLSSRPYTDGENSRADSDVAAQHALDVVQAGQDAMASSSVLDQIASVIAAAAADVAAATALQGQATADAQLGTAPDAPWRQWVDGSIDSLVAYRLWADETVQQLAGVVQTIALIVAKETS